ncbi:MAG: hypothetical protein ACRENP_25615 [Longimicrobiales bacterium]
MSYVLVAAIVLTAVAAVAWPLLRRSPDQLAQLDDAALEARITAYRSALKADTVCPRCLRDNPNEAHYCADCGMRLNEILEARS